MLSMFVHRHKYWNLPLLISLVFSWCMLFCQNMAQAAWQPDPQATHAVKMEGTVPPCHSAVGAQPDHSVHNALVGAVELQADLDIHGSCTGCEQPAAAIEPLSLANCAILVSWLHTALAHQLEPSANVTVLQSPPRRPAQPLYLTKNVFLI